ncbi:MAG: hypothetical protein EBX41_02875 [Chitinophagia bacterium]|nr:hypothetical protein [Chitinophagia bacterium]
MIKRIIPIALISAATLGITACSNSSSFKKIHGTELMIIKDASGKNADTGQVLEVHVCMKLGKNDGKSKDSVIQDSRKENHGEPIMLLASKPQFSGDWRACLTYLSAGDSAIIRVPTDTLMVSLKDKGGVPPDWKKGEYVVFELNVVHVISRAEAEKKIQEMQEKQMKEMKEKQDKQAATDSTMLQEYFAKNNIKPLKLASGLYYTIANPGKGEDIKQGKEVTMNYTGKLLDGTVFDSNLDPQFKHTEPFKFQVGMGMVIPGWDEGVQKLKKGAKATLYVPSGLAYGENPPSAKIPVNAILVFDVEVTDVGEPKREQQPASPMSSVK